MDGCITIVANIGSAVNGWKQMHGRRAATGAWVRRTYAQSITYGWQSGNSLRARELKVQDHQRRLRSRNWGQSQETVGVQWISRHYIVSPQLWSGISPIWTGSLELR